MKAKTSPLPAASPARTYGVALASVFVATVLRWLLQPALGPNLQFITYFPAVFVTAVLGGLQPALIATALSLFLAEYLFFLPAEGFNFHDTSALTGLLLFGVTSVGIGWLGQARLRGLARARQAAQEAQRQEQLAGEAEATYRALAELSPDAILVKQNRAYVFANPAAARLCGAANEHELIGRTPYEFLDAEVQDVVRQRVQRVLEDHVAASALQCRWRRLDGSAVEVELAAGPLTWRGEPAVQLVLRDI
ncbi:MAG: DUF4118 domain-containing protein, partial [Gemmatimonadales bacterium]